MFPQCRRLVSQRVLLRDIAASRRVPRQLLSSATTATASSDGGSTLSSSSMADQKRRLALAALKQVPVHGWTQDAITAATIEMEDPKMNVSMAGLLTPQELVNFLMDSFNDELQTNQALFREKNVFGKLKWRLEQVIPLVEGGQWHKGMAMGALQTPLKTRSQLHEFIEIVAPPGSTTLYKTALGGVFVATELHLLTDASENYQDTWEFLRLRLDELERGDYVSGMMDLNNIPVAATTAVATSLWEGVWSLLAPPPSTTGSGSSSSSSTTTNGTKPSDYMPKE